MEHRVLPLLQGYSNVGDLGRLGMSWCRAGAALSNLKGTRKAGHTTLQGRTGRSSAWQKPGSGADSNFQAGSAVLH